MCESLSAHAQAYPQFVELHIIGKTREGRDIPAITLTNQLTGPAKSKSAVFIDANIHAGEVATNAAAMYFISWCLENYGQDQRVRELLDVHTVYIVPRISVDGAERYLTTPERYRSSAHLYPYVEPREGFIPEDVNGDGHILQMRIPAEDGAFAVDEVDKRIMRPRRPGEFGGQYYHVFPEGRTDRLTQRGTLPAFAEARSTRRSAMDFNRNFPIRWAGESGQPGAGPFPLSEPELRALADFIVANPNISAYAALHTTGGVILRQPSTGDDTVLSEMDRHLFTRVADMGAKESGYHAGSNYQIFATGHEKILMPGAGDDWMYDHLGVLSFTVEMWDLAKHAGARGYGELGMRKLMTLSPEERLEDQRKIYAWVEKEVPSDGIFDWALFHHPEFGEVEIGGLNPKFVIQNPPLTRLEEECEAIRGFIMGLSLSIAKLLISSVQVTEEGANLYRIVAEVSNAGFLPTSSTSKGKELELEGLHATLAGEFEMVAGVSPQPLPHLDGFGGHDAWAPPSAQRAHVEWLIRARPDTRVTVSFSGPRAGRVSTDAILRK